MDYGMKSRAEDLRPAPETFPEGDYAEESQSDLKAGHLRINRLWHEVRDAGEAHGLRSRQYLEKVLSVLREELAYFSFIAGVCHCGVGGRFPEGDIVERLNEKIQESVLKIGRVEKMLEAPANGRPPAIRTAAAMAQSKFLPAALGSAKRTAAAELADVEVRCEEVDWEYGQAFFNKSCIGIIDGYRENRIEGLVHAEAVKAKLEKRRRRLAGRAVRGNV